MRSAAGIVLAGGNSTRMGTAKAGLEWHGSTLLRRTTGILSRVVDGPTVVVCAAGQQLPELPAHVEIVTDPAPDLGPLQGIAAGLAAVAGRADMAFVCSTDMPFLHPAFVRTVLRALHASGEAVADLALPVIGGFPQPLAAGYLTALAPVAGRLVAQRRLRAALLAGECGVRRLDEQALLAASPVLAALDPDLDSVLNVNEPAGYRAARTRPPPEIAIRRFGALAQAGPVIDVVRAATVARAAARAGIELDEHVAVGLNGDLIPADGHLPLVTGDTVYFIG
jgi:molybdenum cofactor guanylyltransferase